MQPIVSICIACYKDDPFLSEAIESVKKQTYPCEICVYHDRVGVGTGEAFNQAIKMAKGEIIVLLCSDDVFTNPFIVQDIVDAFGQSNIGHVSRYYHQFVDGDRSPVRAWRTNNIIELANNPSGMAFRKEAITSLTNSMFIEVAKLVDDVIKQGWKYSILKYDTIAVRIHKSISRTPGYYKKMWNSSPVEEWAKLGWKTNDFTHLIQVGINFEKNAVHSEAAQFLKINKLNIINPSFLFFYLVALLPSSILYRIPEIYRSTVGKWTTREVKRP